MRNNTRWIVVGLIVVASFIFYVLRLNVSIVAGTMSRDLGLTEIQLGMIFSAFAAGYAIFRRTGAGSPSGNERFVSG